jgi:hypothetical protein
VAGNGAVPVPGKNKAPAKEEGEMRKAGLSGKRFYFEKDAHSGYCSG